MKGADSFGLYVLQIQVFSNVVQPQFTQKFCLGENIESNPLSFDFVVNDFASRNTAANHCYLFKIRKNVSLQSAQWEATCFFLSFEMRREVHRARQRNR